MIGSIIAMSKHSKTTALLRSQQRPRCHILLTGQPSVGKTTLIKAIIDACSTGNDDNGPSSRHKDGHVLKCKQNVKLSGFYTEESRADDGRRDGFDLISFSDDATDGNADSCCRDTSTRITRTRLSRAQLKPNKRKPFVGKYLVDVDNVDRYGVKSLRQLTSKLRSRSTEEESRTICILDEVGKMELLCPAFLPAVHGVLDAISEYNTRATRKNSCLLLGTIPTPRYGRVIPAVEDIRARDDVMVLHVTKNNRDELRNKLSSLVNSWIEGTTTSDEDWNESGFEYGKDLEAYLYERPIGSGSMNPTSDKHALKKGPEVTTLTEGAMGRDSELVPCDPLVHSTIKPRVLVLGHTASPKPHDPKLAYCERSMWKILSRIHDVPHESINDAASVAATTTQVENYQRLANRVLRSGICIWDTLANVHAKGRSKRKGKRKTMGDDDGTDDDARPNALLSFLKEHGSIRTIAFVGTKAHGEFAKHFGKDALEQYSVAILPSSSPANSRLTVEEKANQWVAAFRE